MRGWIQHRGFAGALIGVLLGAAFTLGGPGAHAGEDVAEIALADQFGHTDSLAAHRGEVVLVFVVEVSALLNTRFWEEDLREQIDGITYLRVADVAAGGSASRERIATKLRLVVPDGVPVMIDTERRWARSLDLDTSEPNLLAYTRDGLLGARYRGRWHPDSVPDIVVRLRQLLALP